MKLTTEVCTVAVTPVDYVNEYIAHSSRWDRITNENGKTA